MGRARLQAGVLPTDTSRTVPGAMSGYPAAMAGYPAAVAAVRRRTRKQLQTKKEAWAIAQWRGPPRTAAVAAAIVCLPCPGCPACDAG